MIALIQFVLAMLAAPFRSKSQLEAENAALRQQLVVVQRKVKGRVALSNGDRLFFVQLYRWFPSILEISTIIQPETSCVGIGPAFVVIGAGNHGDAADGRRFRRSCGR